MLETQCGVCAICLPYLSKHVLGDEEDDSQASPQTQRVHHQLDAGLNPLYGLAPYTPTPQLYQKGSPAGF